MKKKIICLLLLFTLVFSLFVSKVEARNEITNEPYDTWIVGLEGDLVISSMAYEGISTLNVGFKSPQDIYIDDNDVKYVADTGNKVVYKFTSNTDVVEIGKGVLKEPYGVTVANNGNVYVADKDGCVYVFDTTGAVITKYTRPNEPLFGTSSKFEPIKVAVDDSYNLYVISAANTNGVIQLNADGSFAGYFGPHQTVVSFDSILTQIINGEEVDWAGGQLETTNVAVDSKNSVYTLVDKTDRNSLKKFNINGTNILGGAHMHFSENFKDIAVDKDGFIYTVSDDQKGVISVRDKTGSVLFAFGNKSSGNNAFSIGNFKSPIGIDVDSNGNIWVLDSVDLSIQVFTKTTFAFSVINAMNLYDQGLYDKAAEAYEDLIAQNSSFTQAYVGLGNIAQREQRYEEARDYYRIANDKAGYSNAYWEIRDNWISDYILWVFAVLALLLALKLFKVDKKVLAGINNKFGKQIDKVKNNKFVQEIKYLPRMLTSPNDTIYDIKFLVKIRFSTGIILFLFFIFINIFCDVYATAYIFRTQLDSDVNLAFELLKWGLIILLIVIGNHLVSSLQKGEGFFRDIFVGMMVAFAPILLFKLPLSILSNFLTYNESYIFELINLILWAWSIFNCILVIKSVHNYKLGEFILNVILTAFVVIILVFLFLMVYILFMQFYDFFVGIIKEAILR